MGVFVLQEVGDQVDDFDEGGRIVVDVGCPLMKYAFENDVNGVSDLDGFALEMLVE